jgi:hypothetical protein
MPRAGTRHPLYGWISTIGCACSLVAMESASAMTPGGLAAGHAYAPAAQTVTTMSSTITVSVDPGVSSYFWAQQFWLDTTVDHGGYFGIQGNGITNGQVVGKMFIFSIWNAVGAQADPGAIAQTFGGEGVGWSIHRTIDWQPSIAYTFSLSRVGVLGWRVAVHASSGEEIGLGRIDVTAEAALSTGLANFTEYYGDLPACVALPHAEVTFSNLRYDDAPVSFDDTHAYGPCASHAIAQLPGSGGNTHRINVPDAIHADGFD